MLSRLYIQNYAIIDELEIDFPNHFSSMTGETGAGKSIIVGALGLILGQRADSNLLLNKEKKLVVEGYFQGGPKKSIQFFFQANDLDDAEEIVIRREIGTNGKSRAFINDTPVNLSQLEDLGFLLVDLHQQFDTLSVGESTFQREVLDALAGQLDEVEHFSKEFAAWQQEVAKLKKLIDQQHKIQSEASYDKFQLEELEAANFKENEIESIDADLKLLSNAEGIQLVLDKALQQLQEGESPVLAGIKSLLSDLRKYVGMQSELAGVEGRLQSTYVELQDIVRELDHISSRVQHDPAKMEKLNERLSLGYRLQKKHNVNSTAELLAIQQQLTEKLQQSENLDDIIKEKSIANEQLKLVLEKKATKISAARKKQIKPLEEQVNQLLVRVGMPAAKLKVSIEVGNFTASGLDQIDFLFDANKSGQFQPLRKVASGGELSRVMLCIKSLVAASVDLPTMIFDEIDTGISGEAARQVGIIMQELSANRQIICITHQPQIAAKASSQFQVYKQEQKAGTKLSADSVIRTGIRKLNKDERIDVIAKMLSGEKPTSAALANAREMLS